MNDEAKIPESGRPEGLADDEWGEVLKVRRRKADEARLVTRYDEILADLQMIAGDESDAEWDRAFERFSDLAQRSPNVGWSKDELESFVFAGMRTLGYADHRGVWKRVR